MLQSKNQKTPFKVRVLKPNMYSKSISSLSLHVNLGLLKPLQGCILNFCTIQEVFQLHAVGSFSYLNLCLYVFHFLVSVKSRSNSWPTAYLKLHTLHSSSLHVDEWQYWKWPFPPKRLLTGKVRHEGIYWKRSGGVAEPFILLRCVSYKFMGSWWEQVGKINVLLLLELRQALLKFSSWVPVPRAKCNVLCSFWICTHLNVQKHLHR